MSWSVALYSTSSLAVAIATFGPLPHGAQGSLGRAVDAARGETTPSPRTTVAIAAADATAAAAIAARRWVPV